MKRTALKRKTPLKPSRKPLAKKKKKRSKAQILRDKLWDIFSIYIRTRDKGTCFTCGARNWNEELGEFDIRGMQAGHFKHTVLDFDEMNINCQCVRCNHHLSGNGTVYAMNLIRKYGLEAVEDLERRATHERANGRKYTEEELLERINYYKQKTEELKRHS